MRSKHQPSEPLKQTLHIVAHLDFLGSQDMMKSKKTRDWLLLQMKEIYGDIADLVDNAPQNSKTKIITRIFSDNIVFAHKVSTPVITFDDYQYVAWWAAFFQAYALTKNLVLRGGISFGSFYCDEIFVYGEALAKAYEIENKRAIYPRVVVDNKLLENTIFTGEINSAKEKTFFKDFDGEWCVNFISPAIERQGLDNSQKFLLFIRANILQMYADNKNDPKRRAKYCWLINKFNDLVKKAGYDQCVIPMTSYNTPDTVLTTFLMRGEK